MAGVGLWQERLEDYTRKWLLLLVVVPPRTRVPPPRRDPEPSGGHARSLEDGRASAHHGPQPSGARHDGTDSTGAFA